MMDPLSCVEQFLGVTITNAWPSTIIEELFMDVPTDTTLRHVTTFMRGNRVPIQMAIDCFNARNGMHQCYVDEKFHEWYYIYDGNPYKFHKAKYYSVALGKMAWINGWAHNDGVEQAVVPSETVAKIGLEGVACKRLVQCCINIVREGQENVPQRSKATAVCVKKSVHTNKSKTHLLIL
jgi:hypothetical protein